MTPASASKTSAVRDYTAAGYVLFPCRANAEKIDDRKKPLQEGWQATKYDAMLDAASLPEIYGVLLSATDFILEYDPRRDDKDKTQFADFMAKFDLRNGGDIIDTFIVESGRNDGGIHIYMTCKPGRKFKQYVPDFNAFEPKSLGRYVIGAGSIHPLTGAPYTVYRGTPDNVMEAPEALLEWCEQEERLEEGTEDDSQANQDRFIRYCCNTSPAIQGSGGDITTFRTACTGRDYGLSEDVVSSIMAEYFNPRCSPPWSLNALVRKVSNAFAYAQNAQGSRGMQVSFDELVGDAAGTADGLLQMSVQTPDRTRLSAESWDFVRSRSTGELTETLKPTLRNAVNFFLIDNGHKEGLPNPLKGLVGYNEMSHRIEFRKQAPWHNKQKVTWRDADSVQAKFYLQTVRHYPATTDMVDDAVIIVAEDARFHPVKDWLNSLKWDGEKRLDTWLIDVCGADDDEKGYTREVSRIALLSLVARVFEPGCQHDYMIVLEGRQGIYKSTLVKEIGGEWSTAMSLCVANDAETKRVIAKMVGKWVIEIPELLFTKKQEVEAVRAFITTRVDNALLPYARFAQDIPRQSTMFGTFNPNASGTYLNDETGNRRFLPVPVTHCDIPKFRQMREQLFAEAVARYKTGERWHMEDEAIIKEAAHRQNERMVKEPWAERVGEYLDDPANKDEIASRPLTTGFIQRIIGIPNSRMDRLCLNRIGAAMRELGYRQKTTRIQQKQVKVWVKE